MLSRARKVALTLAPLACVALISAALMPRLETRFAADIDDLKLSPQFGYYGRLYSKTNPSFQGRYAAFFVETKNGKKFAGEESGFDVEGSVTPAGKVTGTVRDFDSLLTADYRNGGAPLPDYTFKGQLSADGSAIIGTYKIKGAEADQGTCYFEAKSGQLNR